MLRLLIRGARCKHAARHRPVGQQ